MDINPSSFMVGNSSYNPERSPLIDPAALVVEVAGNSSYNAYNTPQIDPTALLMDAATSSIYSAFRPPLINPSSPLMMDFTGYTGFQPFSNPPQALPGVRQLSPTYIDGYNFSFPYIQSNELNMLPYMAQSHQSGQYANFNLPSRMNTTEKGTATEGAPQGEEENSAMGFYTAHSYPGHGNPSQF
ncbi:hypothetical protein P3X46_012557 [Hevea brasiliensis]|uniref:Uncharacterized protein n=2 Tax=Hevea brasiliensis TaxID=3981 RepID=A0ABQ9MEI1_HEVBR|nr:hypothetical protein P3X46_012557 [Hevea brasiliensis]